MPEPLPEQAVKPRDMKQELFKGSCFFIRLIYKPFLSLKNSFSNVADIFAVSFIRAYSHLMTA